MQQHRKVIIPFLVLLLQPEVASGHVLVMWAILQAVMADLVVVGERIRVQQLMVALEIHHQYHHHKEILVVEMVDLQVLLIVLVVVEVQVV
jgi:hypothetical protein